MVADAVAKEMHAPARSESRQAKPALLSLGSLDMEINHHKGTYILQPTTSRQVHHLSAWVQPGNWVLISFNPWR